MYLKKLTDRLILRNAVSADARVLADLQRRVFPTLSAAEIINEKHFFDYVDIFPEGQVVVVFDDQVIASTSTFRCQYPSPNHKFLEVTGDLTLATHDPDGEWMYGFDMGVEPELQGLGLGRYLYAARHEIARTLGMAGQVIVGMPSGYGKVRATLPFDEYYAQILNGESFDPTVSVQMKMGFEPDMVIPDYLDDPKCGCYGIMMKLSAERVIAPPRMLTAELEERIARILTGDSSPLRAAIEVSKTDSFRASQAGNGAAAETTGKLQADQEKTSGF